MPITESGSTPIAISISTSGQYVIPSPYERQRPRRTSADVADALEEVGDEARLADAGRPEEREEPARSVGDRVLVVAPEPLPLALAADERRLRMACERPGVADHLEEPERLDRLGLPFQHERLDGLDANRVAHEQPGLGADEHLARGAACSRRAATLTASPVTSVSPSPPTTTSPVLTPMRASSPCSEIAGLISEAARTARSASSSCETGIPKTAMTASPTNFSTVPP